MKRAALSAPSLVIAPASRIGLLAIDADGAALEPRERGDHLGRERLAQEGHRAGVGEPLDRGRGRRRRGGGARGRRRAARPGRARPSRRAGPGSRRAGAWSAATASASSATATSTTPFGAWTSSGPIASGSNVPRPPPSIIAGPPMPERGALGGDDQVRAAGEDRVAGEAAAGDDRDPRHDAREPRPEREGARVERRDDRVVGVARAARRRPRRAARSAGACARSARTGGPSCGGRSRPACRPAPCSRRRAPRRRRARRAGRR